MNILIKNAKIIDPESTEDQAWYPGNIAIKNDRIFAVGNIPSDFKQDRTVDVGGNIVLPGLINTHTHLAMNLLRGIGEDLPLDLWLHEKIWPAEEHHTEESVAIGTELAIAESLKAGVTSCMDMYLLQDVVGQVLEKTGMRGVLSRAIITAEGNVEKKIKESVQMAETYSHKADGRVSVFLSGHAAYTCDVLTLTLLKDYALQNKLGINIHVSETQEEVDRCIEKHQKTPVQYLADLGLFDAHTVAAHCVHVTKEDIAIMKEKNVSVAHNPESNLKLASGIAPISEMLHQGVNVALGTDSAASNNNLDLFDEMKMSTMLQKGVSGDATFPTVKDVLKMATVNGAKALKLRDVGRLLPGWKADLIVVDTHKPHMVPGHDPATDLVYSASGSDVTHTMVNGKFLMENGELTTIDEKKVIAKAREIGKNFLL